MFDRKTIIRLYIPILIEQTLATLLSMFGTMLVSGVSAAAVSGVGLVDGINLLVMSVFMALATGVTVMVSQYIGAGDRARAGRAAIQSLTVTTGLAVTIGGLVAIFARPLLMALFGRAADDVMDAACTYLLFSALSMPLQAIYAAAGGIMRAAGNTKGPMFAAVCANAAYLGVASLCIFVFDLGVAGVGIGFVAARLTAAAVSVALMVKSSGKLPLPHISFKLEQKVLFPVLRIAVPIGLDTLLFNGGKIIVQVFISGMGTDALAANAIANAIHVLCYLPGISMSLLSMTMVGNCFGSGDLQETQRCMNRSMAQIVALNTVGCLITYLSIDGLLALYNPTPGSYALAHWMLVVGILAAPIGWSASFACPGMLRAVGDVRLTTAVSIASMIVLRIGGSWFLGVYLGWGVKGIWIAMLADWLGRAAVFVPRMFSGAWRRAARPPEVDVEVNTV